MKYLQIMLLVLIVCLAGCSNHGTINVDADVLSINQEILEGKLIAHFLSGSSGWLKSDRIKVGVKFQIHNELFLEDLCLSHAQLAYYGDKKTLPLKLKIYVDRMSGSSSLEIRLGGYFIKKVYLSRKLAKRLHKYSKEDEE